MGLGRTASVWLRALRRRLQGYAGISRAEGVEFVD